MNPAALSKPEVSVRPAGPEEIPAAASVVALAFQAEALTNRLFDLSHPGARRRLAREYTGAIELKWRGGDTFLVALTAGKIVGAALVNTPGQTRRANRPAILISTARLILGLLGLVGSVRWRRLRPTWKAARPPKTLPRSRDTLVGIAVAPDKQGKGIGRMLLDATRRLSEDNPESAGTYLFTADETNREIYARFGYTVVKRATADGGFTVHHMFRPRSGKAPGPDRP